MQQLGAGALNQRRILVGTYGSCALAGRALASAKRDHATLVVCFIRSVRLRYNLDRQLTMDTDIAALKTFAKFLDLAYAMGVPVLPIYDSGDNAAELLAEAAALTGCERILIGTSRQGALYHLIKGHFQQQLEQLLPPEDMRRGPAAGDAGRGDPRRSRPGLTACGLTVRRTLMNVGRTLVRSLFSPRRQTAY